MRSRILAIATLAVGLLVAAAVFAAPSQAAITWTNLGNVKDHQNWDTCDGDVGYASMEVQWHISSDNRLRVGSAHGIIITNDSSNRLPIRPAQLNGAGSLFYERAYAPIFISGYHYGSSVSYVNPHTTVTLSTSNPDRWLRMDGAADADPSPYNTYISTSSDPRVAMTVFPEVYIQGSWHPCGANPITLETVNNAA